MAGHTNPKVHMGALTGGSAQIGFAGGNETLWDNGSTSGGADSVFGFNQSERPDLAQRRNGRRNDRSRNRGDGRWQHNHHIERRLAYHAARRFQRQQHLLHDALRAIFPLGSGASPLAPLRISQIICLPVTARPFAALWACSAPWRCLKERLASRSRFLMTPRNG